MMNNKMIYDTLQRDDPSFLTRVLFKVDTAIRIHLQSCKEKENRVNVNNKILFMEEFQQNIEAYSFSQHIPEIVQAKHEPQEQTQKCPTEGYSGRGGGRGHKKNGNDKNGKRVENKNKCFTIKQGECWSKIFYKTQGNAPNDNGKPICLLYHI